MTTFYEFFAGGGMARAGLGDSWKCLFANDFDHKKSDTYRRNWGDKELLTGDVRNIKLENLPDRANLVWGSFPCQDLSLAGAGAGLKGDRSGTFWPFWDLIKGLVENARAPEIIALENVVGTLHSHNGQDFAAICTSLHNVGYRFGAMVIDASIFLPHSRPRLFIIGIRNGLNIPESTHRNCSSIKWHSRILNDAYNKLPDDIKKSWIWWDLPTPPERIQTFKDLIEEHPKDVKWHTPAETAQLLSMMSEINLKKIEAAKKLSRKNGICVVGTIYKRTRRDKFGLKIQRAEVRFDDIAGCLRTPSGGSSRQLIIVVEGGKVKSRLISSRETARLMGLQDDYILPESYNEAYHLTGDGVAVPVVRHISENIFIPIISLNITYKKEAA